jgi:RNA polymerase sigma-70 factor (ECF subfamily)
MPDADERGRTVAETLQSVSAEGGRGTDTLVELVYAELRDLAAGYLHRERDAWTLQPTALVNEAYLKLVGHEAGWESRAHFVGAAARAMRQLLVDAARERNAQKRGGGAAAAMLDEKRLAGSRVSLDEALALDEALGGLASAHERPARVAELRYFGEMTIPQVAHVLGVSTSTVDADWAFAKAWLARAMSEETRRG